MLKALLVLCFSELAFAVRLRRHFVHHYRFEDILLSASSNSASSSPSGPDWGFSTWNNQQTVLVVLFFVFLIVTIVCFHWTIFKPLKLLTVFLHEFSHATAAWLTCGKVEKISVESDEGGVTTTRGGIQRCILPAGYLGSSFWGCFFLIMATIDELTSAIAAGMLALALLLVLVFYAGTNTLRILCMFFIGVLVVLFLIDFVVIPSVSSDNSIRVIPYFLLFVGVNNGAYAVIDIYDDLIRRKVAGSDASKFAEICCGHPRCWGIIWCLVSLIFLFASMYIALALEGANN